MIGVMEDSLQLHSFSVLYQLPVSAGSEQQPQSWLFLSLFTEKRVRSGVCHVYHVWSHSASWKAAVFETELYLKIKPAMR